MVRIRVVKKISSRFTSAWGELYLKAKAICMHGSSFKNENRVVINFIFIFFQSVFDDFCLVTLVFKTILGSKTYRKKYP